jgi:hypothetical protein
LAFDVADSSGRDWFTVLHNVRMGLDELRLFLGLMEVPEQPHPVIVLGPRRALLGLALAGTWF